MLHSSGMHKQGVFASKASPLSVLINWDRLSLVLRAGGDGASGAHTNTELIRVLISTLAGPGGLNALPAGIAKALETAREGGDPHRSPACTAELRLGARAFGVKLGI